MWRGRSFSLAADGAFCGRASASLWACANAKEDLMPLISNGPVAMEGATNFQGSVVSFSMSDFKADVRHFLPARRTAKRVRTVDSCGGSLPLFVRPVREACELRAWKWVSVPRSGEREHFVCLLLHGLPTRITLKGQAAHFHDLWGVPPMHARAFVGIRIFYRFDRRNKPRSALHGACCHSYSLINTGTRVLLSLSPRINRSTLQENRSVPFAIKNHFNARVLQNTRTSRPL